MQRHAAHLRTLALCAALGAVTTLTACGSKEPTAQAPAPAAPAPTQAAPPTAPPDTTPVTAAEVTSDVDAPRHSKGCSRRSRSTPIQCCRRY